MNRFELFNAMVNKKVVVLGGFMGLITGIELEDGSGHCFNVQMVSKTFEKKTIFIRG